MTQTHEPGIPMPDGFFEVEVSRPITPCRAHDIESTRIDDQEISFVPPLKPFLIGISGKLGTGKDETYRIINELVMRKASNVKFAEKLKNMCAILIGCSREMLEDRAFKNTPIPHLNGLTPRQVMINVGDGLRELLYPRVWIDAAKAEFTSHTAVTDVRYPNEGDEILNEGGILIRLERDGIEKLDTPTETAMDDYPRFTYKVDNNGTIPELANKIYSILSREGII